MCAGLYQWLKGVGLKALICELGFHIYSLPVTILSEDVCERFEWKFLCLLKGMGLKLEFPAEFSNWP
jgi:hypothetical protein